MRYILIALIGITSCSVPAAPPQSSSIRDSLSWSIKGFCWSAPIRAIDSSAILEYQKTNSNSIAIMPYGFCSESNPSVMYNRPKQYWGERDSGVMATIDLAQKAGLSVMIKPHLWLPKGTYTGELSFETEAKWKEWELGYTEYIVHFARIADSMQVSLLCFGTELGSVVRDRPAYFPSLIDTLRKVYKGKITYASNWNDFQEVHFWKLLDVIGIDAYFTLSKDKTPSIATLRKDWVKYKGQLQKISEQTGKQILMTEFGYRNSDFCTREPWKEDVADRNDTSQVNALQAFFITFGNEKWVAGGYLWKWYPDQEQKLYASDVDFTPQGKPALDSIRIWYKHK